MLDRITDKKEWDLGGIMLLTMAIDYTDTYEQAQLLFREAIIVLNKHFKNNKRYNNIKAALHINMLYRLVKAKYFDMGKCEESAELGALFEAHFNVLIIHCEIKEFPGSHIYEALALIRKGFFKGDYRPVKLGLGYLKANNENELYEIMLAEAGNYVANAQGVLL